VLENMHTLQRLQEDNLGQSNTKRFRYGEEHDRSFAFDFSAALEYYGGEGNIFFVRENLLLGAIPGVSSVQAQAKAYPLREPGFCHERFTELPLYLAALGYHLGFINVCVDAIDIHAQLTCRAGDQALLGLSHLGDVRLPAAYAELLVLAHKYGLASQAEVWLAVPLTPGLASFALAVFPCPARTKSNCVAFMLRAATISDCVAANGLRVLAWAADGDAYQLRALKHLQHGAQDTIPWHGRPLMPGLLSGLHAGGMQADDCLTVCIRTG
jgi:hypothetical protein